MFSSQKSSNTCTLSEGRINTQKHRTSLYWDDQNFMADFLIMFGILTAIGLTSFKLSEFWWSSKKSQCTAYEVCSLCSFSSLLRIRNQKIRMFIVSVTNRVRRVIYMHIYQIFLTLLCEKGERYKNSDCRFETSMKICITSISQMIRGGGLINSNL